MNALLLKIWDFLKQKNRWLIALVIIIILSQYGIIRLKNNKIADLTEKYKTEVKLKDALLDTVKNYQNSYKEWVAEKLTIQETVKNLEKMFGQLTESQKELINRVKEINKKNEVIAAALIETNFKIDSLRHDVLNGGETKVDTAKKTVSFNNLASKDTTFKYNIEIGQVLPVKLNFTPTLLFRSIEIPNKQFVNFQWKNDRKKGYPISFTISNSNKYINVINVESYAIPPLDKVKLNPSGWQKIGNFFIKNGRTLLYVGVGAAGGVGGYYLLTK